MATQKIPVASYLRFSSDNQNDNSIQYQKENILAYAYKHDYEIVDTYIDEGYSATTSNRPAFQEMIADAQKKHRWKKVLIYDFSRFARNKSDAAY